MKERTILDALKDPIDRHGATRGRGVLAAGLLLLATCAGCPTEVPYAPVGSETHDAPPADPRALDEQPLGSRAEGEATLLSREPEAPEPVPPDPTGSRYADPDPQATPGQKAELPWWNNEESAPPSEAGDLFAGLSADPPAEAEPSSEEPAADPPADDGFGDFLAEAYSDVVTPEPAPNSSAEPIEPSPTRDTVSFEPEVEEPPPATLPNAPPENLLPFEMADPAPEAKIEAPASTESVDPLEDLWANMATPSPEAAAEPEEPQTPLPESEAPVEPPLPLEDRPLDELPAPTPPEPLPEADLEADPLPDPRPEAESIAPLRTAMAAPAVDPLPPVPVAAYNTRHLAWLLGGKLSLAELADLDGATPGEIAAWSDEATRLARELQVGLPPTSRADEQSEAQRVQRLMQNAARLGSEVAQEHGVDHAALLEISLKTNALLMVARERPDLAGPVASAIRGAADRAVLPSFLWEEAVQRLSREPDAEQALDAIVRLHERVESFLR